MSKPETIVITGTCTENVVITMDDVTIRGGNFVPADTTQNTILVNGARRVTLTGINVTGGRNGISVYQGGSLTVSGNSVISGGAVNGVVAAYGSSVIVNSSTISANARGLTATDNSALVLTLSTVSNNTSTGVLVNRSSNARIGQSISGVVGANTIAANAGSGVSIRGGSNAFIDHNSITGNGGEGIHIEGSTATVTNNTVSGSHKGISVHNSGGARIGISEEDTAGSNTVTDNAFEGIQVANGSSAYIYANTVQNNGQGEGRPGIAIYRATGRLIGDNTIQGNGGHGVEVDQGSLLVGTGDFNVTPGRDLITGNTNSGISGWNGSHLDVQNVNVTGNTQNGILLSLQSTLRIYDATVSGNQNGIVLYDGSSVARYSTDSPRDSITANSNWGIYCSGGSKLIGVTSGVTGNSVAQVVGCGGGGI